MVDFFSKFKLEKKYYSIKSKKGRVIVHAKFVTRNNYIIKKKKYIGYEYFIKCPNNKNKIFKLIILTKGTKPTIKSSVGFSFEFFNTKDIKNKKQSFRVVFFLKTTEENKNKHLLRGILSICNIKNIKAMGLFENFNKNLDIRNAKSEELVNAIASKIGDEYKKALRKQPRGDLEKFYTQLSVDDSESTRVKIREELDRNDSFEKAQSISRYVGIATLLTSAVALLFMIYKYYKDLEIIMAEREVDSAEKELAEKLYGRSKVDISTLDEYADLVSSIKNVVTSKRIKGLLVYGGPGTGKTFTIRKILYRLGADYSFVKGSVDTLDGFFKLLYKNRKRLIVLDDFDTPIKDERFINIIKAALDTSEPRIIYVPTNHAVDKDTAVQIPQRFVYRGKIIIITNLRKDEIDSAVRSRIPSIEIDFTNDQFINIIRKTLVDISPDVPLEIKQEVLNFLVEFKSKHPDVRIDFRTFAKVLDLRLAYPNEWQKKADRILAQ